MGKKILSGQIVGIYPKKLPLDVQWWVSYWSGEDVPRKLKALVPNLLTYEARLVAADRLIADIKANCFLPLSSPSDMTVRIDYIKKAFELLDARKGTLPDKTYSQFKGHLVRLNDWCNEQGLRSISPSVCDKFLDELLGSGLSPITVNNYRCTFNALFNHLAKRKNIRSNPFKDTDVKKGESDCPEWYKEYEAQRLKKYMLEHKPFVWAAARWEFYCLMRPSSIRGLKVSDIDFHRWMVKLRSGNAKNSKSYWVAIPEGLQKELKPLCLYQYPPTFHVVGLDGLPSEFPVGKNYWNRHHNKVLEALKFDLDTHTFYGWKHTGFALAYLNGVGILELMRQAGHHSPDETYKYMRKLGLEDFTTIKEKYPIL